MSKILYTTMMCIVHYQTYSDLRRDEVVTDPTFFVAMM